MNPWSTACPDWENRILEGRPLVPALPLYADQAAKALRVFKRLKLPDVIGTPKLADSVDEWFLKIVEALFGSYNAATNRRMLQEVFLLVPKKNGKSTFSAAVMLTAIIMNDRPNAEFLLIAPTKEIANISFRQATGMIRADPELRKLFQIQTHIKTITHRLTGAIIQIKAADTDAITGSKSTGILVDETHVFAEMAKAADVFLEVRGALAARPDGFMFQISTQSKSPPAGVFAAELAKARAVRDGKLGLPLLPVIYEFPPAMVKAEAWREEKNFPLVNPNLGRSVDTEFLTREFRAAISTGGEQLALFASQHLNVEIGMALRADGWAGAHVWDRGLEMGLSLDAIIERSELITIGVDGGGLDDLFGLAVLGRETATRKWLLWTHALISREGIERRKANEPVYRDFERDGDLTVVEGLPDDLDYVVSVVERIADTGLLAAVGVDPAGIGSLIDELAALGISQDEKNLDGVRQGISLMGAIKTVERKLVDGTFKHDGSRMMKWIVGNMKIVPTPTAMRIARDESGMGKIDPGMAMFNAVDCMSRRPDGAMIYSGDVQELRFI